MEVFWNARVLRRMGKWRNRYITDSVLTEFSKMAAENSGRLGIPIGNSRFISTLALKGRIFVLSEYSDKKDEIFVVAVSRVPLEIENEILDFISKEKKSFSDFS